MIILTVMITLTVHVIEVKKCFNHMIKIYSIVTTILHINYCILINDFKRCHHRLYLAKSRQRLLRPGNKTLLGLFTFALSLSR